MKVFALALSFFLSSLAFGTSHSTPTLDPALINVLEDLSGDYLKPHHELLIQNSLPKPISPIDQDLLDRLHGDVLTRMQDPDNTSAKVCVTRCSGSGKDKVCWVVCVEN